MKRILLSSSIVLAVAAIVVGGTYAVFSNVASVTGNTFSAGNADLQINLTGTDLSNPDSWADSLPFTDGSWTNLYPGWSDSYSVYLRNNSSSPIDLAVRPYVVFTAADSVLDDNIYLKFTHGNGTAETTEMTLAQWKNNNTATGVMIDPSNPNLVYGDIDGRGPWVAHFRIPETATNTIAGRTITFDLNFNGVQVVPPPAP